MPIMLFFWKEKEKALLKLGFEEILMGNIKSVKASSGLIIIGESEGPNTATTILPEG